MQCLRRGWRHAALAAVALALAGCRGAAAPAASGANVETDATQSASAKSPADQPPIDVFFSPNGGATAAIQQRLAAARTVILVQAYSFTSPPIAQSLVEAHRRGVRVEVILDKSQRTERYSGADYLANQGVPTTIDAEHAIAHNKVMVVDGRIVLTGSFNFTTGAEQRNAENLLVIDDARLAARYADNWRAHRAHAQPYSGRGTQPDSKVPRLKPHRRGKGGAGQGRGPDAEEG